MTTRRTARVLAAALACGAFALGACSSNEDTAPTTPGNTTPEVVPTSGGSQNLPEGPSAGPDQDDGNAGTPGPESPGSGTP